VDENAERLCSLEVLDLASYGDSWQLIQLDEAISSRCKSLFAPISETELVIMGGIGIETSGEIGTLSDVYIYNTEDG